MLNEMKLRLQNGEVCKLTHLDSLFTKQQIETIEKTKKAKYLGEFPYKTQSGVWLNQPVAYFFQEESYPLTGSHYFALVNDPSKGLMIMDGSQILYGTYCGVLVEENEECVGVYSAYRHDCQLTPADTGMSDGGMEYHRYTGTPVSFRFVGMTEEGGAKFLQTF